MSASQKTQRIDDAVSHNSVDGVKALLAAGADPNSRCPNGETALFHAGRGHSKEVVEILLASGADPNVEDRFGITPLTVIANLGDFSAVESLLAHGANPYLVKMSSINWTAQKKIREYQKQYAGPGFKGMVTDACLRIKTALRP